MFEEILQTDLKLYTPLAIKRIFISKPNNKQRSISIPTIKSIYVFKQW